MNSFYLAIPVQDVQAVPYITIHLATTASPEIFLCSY